VTRSSSIAGVCLVDGHNVMHQVPSLAALLKSDQTEEARERLAEACLAFALRRRVRVLLVFDGSRSVHAPAPRANPNLQIVYASGAGKADRWIADRVERLRDEKQSVLVVTEDRGIKNALPKRVRTMGAKAFWSVIHPAREDPADKPAPPLDDVEAYFLEVERRLNQEQDKKKGGA
jgi:predicted RNA-binding protein with PIN domain